MHYLELDALYALKVMRAPLPRLTARRTSNARCLWCRGARLLGVAREELFTLHPHVVLAAVGTFGLLQQHRPDEYRDEAAWTDIFTDRRFYMTAEVKCSPGRPAPGRSAIRAGGGKPIRRPPSGQAQPMDQLGLPRKLPGILRMITPSSFRSVQMWIALLPAPAGPGSRP